MIYAISDLHFMEPRTAVCGSAWRGRVQNFRKHWLNTVAESDLVILAGDMIASSSPSSAAVALRWLDRLPGKKLLLPGNHDRWWPAALPKTIASLSKGVYIHENICVTGVVGWFCPGSLGCADPAGMRVYQREAARLSRRLKTASGLNPEAIIVATHYPPFNALRAESGFTKAMSEHKVRLCVYGHLHGRALRRALNGSLGGVEYRCVSSEGLKYKLSACRLNTARIEPSTVFLL
jgi:predicted phosphohydrolase